VKIFSLSGRVRKPGNYELPFGTTFRELIYTHGGGVQDSRSVKAIMPAGASSSLIVVNDEKVLDTPMDYATHRIHEGHSSNGDVDLLLNVAKQMQGKCLCALGEFATMAVVTGIERFPQDFNKAVSKA
jgi:NADH-quinone oxidoreductase subunit F